MRITDPIAALPEIPFAATEDLDRMIVELADPALRPTPAHQLARAQSLGARFSRDHDPATLAAALQAYRACSYRGQARGLVGRQLVILLLQGGLLGSPVDAAQVRQLIDDAGDDPAVPGTTAVLHSMVDVFTGYADDPGFDRAAALRRLDELERTVPPETVYARMLPTFRTALSVKRGAEAGNLADAQAAAEHARAMLERDDLDPRQRKLAETMLVGAEALTAVQHGEMDKATSALTAMTDMVDELPPDDPATRAMRRLMTGATGTASPEDADQPGVAGAERAWRLLTAASGILQPAVQRKDPQGIARGVRMLREADEVAPPGYVHRPMILGMLGQLLCMQYQLTGAPAALDEAVRRLTGAQQLAGHPGHPVWAPTALALGMAHRLAGRLANSRAEGHRALRGHAWSVLLQAGTANAAAAARDAADDAKQVARWCLTDGDPAGAAAALDSGRCLMLYAATVTMDIPARLRKLGRTDLLARWQGDATDADVRGEVLAALTGGPVTETAVPDVLDPPAVDEIGAALTALHADVLVYLLPADDQGAGCAVLVPAGSVTGRRPAYLPLPSLTATGLVGRHLDGLAIRDAGAVDEPVEPGWRDELNRLCDWAWRSAIGPLLDTLDRWAIGRAPRIALIPMGDLAAVPWHAARDRDGTRVVQIATFTYAASARLLCQVAERAPTADRAPALIVGDPTGDLPAALAEAAAVRSAFYPDAALLDAGAATPEAVRGWMLAGGGAVLHLACHGATGAGVDGSHLRLAGGQRLTARDILTARRSTTIGLVTLAACTTGVPSGAYDEAFSLATAFLATGARSVVGSLWPVPDDATSLLMFMTHHYLRSAGKRPMDALNHAQRWMLDPDRAIPATMPAALSAQVGRLDGDDVAAWAGFTHHGH